MTAMMGPSGAGKTTLLTTLSGRAKYGTPTGQVLVNGEERSLTEFPIGFVPQEGKGLDVFCISQQSGSLMQFLSRCNAAVA